MIRWWSFVLAVGMVACQPNSQLKDYIEPGVSRELAEFRKEAYLNVQYKLSFMIPASKQEGVTGEVHVAWTQEEQQSLVLDFRADASQVVSVRLNGEPVDYRVEQEHITVPASATKSGANEAQIIFLANDQSLNRREEFLYTLLVPDRARTLFPCFDQPNLKALYTLELNVPKEWTAVSNGKILEEDTVSFAGRRVIRFQETEPLPTYLFSFVAGRLQREVFSRGERSISVYHRETDPKRVAQCPEIARQVLDALEWMEEFTAIPYPFVKYDLIVIPGFQFGGMEHTGATLYNDRSLFLNEQPTLDEQLRRSSLIAHETAHMWFGDYVTMDWFDDVWTKEVFANYFAVQITEPMYPAVNHRLNFIRGYVPASYQEDRTQGATPIKQPLDNLQNAGLVYSNIVYDKSPVVMEMLVQRMGKDVYQKGLQEYLQSYGYANATWEELIEVMSRHTDRDLKHWSQVWVNEPGMPRLDAQIRHDSLVVRQTDESGQGCLWPQVLTYQVVGEKATQRVTLEMDEHTTEKAVALPKQAEGTPVLLPNVDGRGYGFFRMTQTDIAGAFAYLDTTQDELLKGSLLINLYENLQRKEIKVDDYLHAMMDYLEHEPNDLLYSMALGYVGSALHFSDTNSIWLEDRLWHLTEQAAKPSFRLQAFRLYVSMADSEAAVARLYQIWKEQQRPGDCVLSETDYMNLSYGLALRMPQEATAIVQEQSARITNPDRQAEYRFISPAVSPDSAVRDSLFQALLQAENRRVEPWVGTAMAYLNHRLRERESIYYIRPALEILQEVQRTGDIFFPTAWLRALLNGHTSEEARKEVDQFLQDHPDFPPMLRSKLLQQADHLYRLNP